MHSEIITAKLGLATALCNRHAVHMALTLILAILVIPTFRVDAQSPATEQEAVHNHAKEIAAIFERTKVASSAKDYSEIIDSIDDAMNWQGLSNNNRQYLHSLKAWAHDLRGWKRSEFVEFFRAANNQPQVELAVEQSFADFAIASELDPNRWQIWMHRGMLNAMISEWEKAIQDFSAVVERDEKNLNAYFNRAECLYQVGKYADALANYNHVLKISPSDLQAITGRAHALLQLGQLDQALEDYHVVVKLKSDDPWSHANRGDVHMQLGDWSSAYNDYNNALEVKQEPDVYRRMAWLLATCPDEEYYRPQAAIELARKAIEAAGETSPRLDVLAACLASAGYFEDAREVQQQAVALADRENEGQLQRMALYEKDEAYLQSIKR